MVDGEVSLQEAVCCGSGQGCSQGAGTVTVERRDRDDTVVNGVKLSDVESDSVILYVTSLIVE